MKKVIATITLTAIGLMSVVGCDTTIEQPSILSGNQSEFTCINGNIYVDGVDNGETVTVSWASPIAGDSPMVKTLTCDGNRMLAN